MVTLITWACFGASIKLVWDMNDPTEEVKGYVVYEIRGTNYVRVATVATNECILIVEPGLHIYTVTATNFWGNESPFSNTARTPAIASAPQGQRVVKMP